MLDQFDHAAVDEHEAIAHGVHEHVAIDEGGVYGKCSQHEHEAEANGESKHDDVDILDAEAESFKIGKNFAYFIMKNLKITQSFSSLAFRLYVKGLTVISLFR